MRCKVRRALVRRIVSDSASTQTLATATSSNRPGNMPGVACRNAAKNEQGAGHRQGA